MKPSLRELTEQALLQRPSLTGILVNAQGDVLYVHGRTGAYLEPVPGEASNSNILKMAREGLGTELATALQKVARTNELVNCPGLRVRTNDNVTAVNLTVRPLETGPTTKLETSLYLVILEASGSELPVGSEPSGSRESARIEALEQELRIKEEQLKSSTAELQIFNEELSATNEELSTSTDELAKANSELQTRMLDLSQANNDMSNMMNGTVFLDRQLRILRFTPAVRQIVNLIPDDVGRPVGQIASNLVGYDRLVPDVRAVLDTLIPQDLEVQTTQGKWYILQILPYRTLDNVIAGAVITFVDITERKRAEEAMKLAKEAAEQANLAKSHFLSTMSHELRTPLNPILGFADLLAESPNLTNEQRTWLRIISQRGQDLLGLIGSVLDLAKIEAEKVTIVREPLLLRQTVRDLVDSILPAAKKKGLTLECDVAAELPVGVLTDGFRLRQVLLNLLNNAIKFTERGSIVVHVRDGRAAPLMRVPSDGEAALLFSVQDTGIGIPADRQAAIFEAFTQADRQSAVKYGGTGLGLTIAVRLVELMGGQIWVESAPGQGSTFWFTLLAGLPPAPTQMAAGISAGASKEAAVRPLKVLIVEDDPASLSMAEFVVRGAGHQVRTALDGKEAVALMEAETFDLILMDVQMPIMDGIEATRLIREREAPLGRHTRIIALTAFAMGDDREKLLNAGMDDYLSKPILAARLREALNAVR